MRNKINSKEINTEVLKEWFEVFKVRQNELSSKFGIPISKFRIDSLYNNTKEHLSKLDIDIKTILNGKGIQVPENIEYSKRTKSDNHIIVLMEKFFGTDNEMIVSKESRDSFNITYECVSNEEEIKKYKERRKRENKLSKDSVEDKLIDNILEYKSNMHLKSIVNSIRELMHMDLEYKLENKDKIDFKLTPIASIYGPEDIGYVHPQFHYLVSHRLQGKEPSLQGVAMPIKECITAPLGYKIMNIDISSQEMNQLVSGILADKSVKRLIEQGEDTYLAFLKAVGFEGNALHRSLIKIPILGIPRGMSLQGAMRDVELAYPELYGEPKFVKAIKDVFHLITQDEGYKAIVDEAWNKQKALPVKITRGLLGTPQEIEGNKRRTFISGIFQITAAEFLCISAINFTDELIMKYRDDYRDLDELNANMRILLPVFDELVAIAPEEKANDVFAILKANTLLEVDDWLPYRCQENIGDHYVGK